MSVLATGRQLVDDHYEQLPEVVQDAACSAYGLQERSRRQGLELTAAPLRAWIEALHWDGQARHRVAHRRLRDVLDTARDLPGYLLRMPGRRTDPFDELRSWPLLEKDHLRADAQGFLSRSTRSGDIQTWTSGTTGGSIFVWKTRDMLRELFLSRDVLMGWHGIGPRDRRANFTGKLAVPLESRRLWRLNLPGRQLIVTPYQLGPDTLDRYYEAFKWWRPRLLLGYPSVLRWFAHLLDERGARMHIPVIEASGEVLTPEVRETISEVLRGRVVDKYGSSENVAYAGECPAGRRHLFENIGVIEVLDDDGQPLPDGETGHITMTTLTNRLMPLVRYRVGDRGALAPPGRCPCGRSSRTLATLDGRSDDVLISPTGRHIALGTYTITRQDRLAGITGVDGVQVVQHSPSSFEIRAVLRKSSTRPAFEAMIRRNLDRYLGSDDERRVEFVYPEDLERTPGGKIRNTIRLFD